MKRLAMMALLATSANAQDHAMTSAEYEHQVEPVRTEGMTAEEFNTKWSEWQDWRAEQQMEPDRVDMHALAQNATPECVKMAQKARSKAIWKMVAVSAVMQMGTTSTAYYSGKINGRKYTSSVTYRDPVKVANGRRLSNEANGNLLSKANTDFHSQTGCGDMNLILYYKDRK